MGLRHENPYVAEGDKEIMLWFGMEEEEKEGFSLWMAGGLLSEEDLLKGTVKTILFDAIERGCIYWGRDYC